ncbi:MAG: hypothetical protein AAF667_16865 [Pseudomonadota bacterium]
MKWAVRIVLGLAVIAALSSVAVSYFFGSMRVDREAAAYLSALETCAPLEQDAWVPLLRGTMARAVAGPDGDACVVTMAGLGGETTRCTLDSAARITMAGFIQQGADTVTFLGGQTASLRYSSENPDPMTELLNGPACETE